jgi:hypothetical protein
MNQSHGRLSLMVARRFLEPRDSVIRMLEGTESFTEEVFNELALLSPSLYNVHTRRFLGKPEVSSAVQRVQGCIQQHIEGGLRDMLQAGDPELIDFMEVNKLVAVEHSLHQQEVKFVAVLAAIAGNCVRLDNM